jgi:hypothetical protein
LFDFRQIVLAECFAGAEFADPIKSCAVKFGCDDDESSDRASKRLNV